MWHKVENREAVFVYEVRVSFMREVRQEEEEDKSVGNGRVTTESRSTAGWEESTV